MDIPKGENEPGKAPADFGKVVDTLHNKSKLQSLRTYQGDMAEYIKDKNESVVSVALKEKERREEREEKVQEEIKNSPEAKQAKQEGVKGGLQMNLKMIILSFVLIVGGGSLTYYIWNTLTNEPVPKVVVTEGEKIITYNNTLSISNFKPSDFGLELNKLPISNGVSVINISDTSGVPIKTSKEFIKFLEISVPPTLERTLKEEYVLGVNSVEGKNYYFLILTVNDFGRAFSGLLEWEEDMLSDLSFLNYKPEIVPFVPSYVATTTATSTVVIPKIFAPDTTYRWRDLIVKNKDTRGFANDRGVADLAYTFLDKNTILITNSLPSIADLSQLFLSRSVVR